MSGRVVLFAKNKNIIYPNGRFLQKFLQFFRAAFLTLSSACFREKKILQEAAVRRSLLKQLFWNIWNYQETIHNKVFW